MKFPALKREIHSLLIKRLLGVCVLTSLVVLGITCYLEFKQLGNTLVSEAEKEARIFVPLFLEQHINHSTSEKVAVPAEFYNSVAHTSFVDVQLSTADGLVFFEKSRGNAAQINQRFQDKSVSFAPGDEPQGSWIVADKRIYLKTLIPIVGLQNDDVIGYVSALYRSSLDDTRAIVFRILLSCLIGAGSVWLCGAVMYPGLVFFQNRLMKSSSELNLANNFLLKQLGSALAKGDVGDPHHNQRLVIYSVRLAEKQKLSRTRIRSLIQGVFLHDLGMMALDNSMLLKQGPLEDKERVQVQNHVKDGVAQIKSYRWLRDGLDVVRCHHEKYDGSGYPGKLSHDKIPLEARLFAIVDAFDALTSKRPYRQAVDVDRAITLLEQGSGSHFDPVLLAPFIEMAPQLLAIVSKLEGKSLEREVRGVLKKYIKL